MANLFSEEILSLSPSRKDGILDQEEKLHRIFGCELVQEAGILLKLPQVVMITGQIILHRYFYRRSLQKDDAFTVAMGCILLASKIEEKPKILREIILVFFYMYQKRNNFKIKNMVLGGTRYVEWKDVLVNIERVILKELGFTFYNTIDHPHKYIIYMVNMLDGPAVLAQKAWNYLNDSMRLDLILRYSEEKIACSVVFMAARFLKIPLPEDEPGPWWKLFVSDINIIYNICGRILDLYELPKLSWLAPLCNPLHLIAASEDEKNNSDSDQVVPVSVSLPSHRSTPTTETKAADISCSIKIATSDDALSTTTHVEDQVVKNNQERNQDKQDIRGHRDRDRRRSSRDRRGNSRDRRRDNSRDRGSSRDRVRRRADSSDRRRRADHTRSRSRSN